MTWVSHDTQQNPPDFKIHPLLECCLVPRTNSATSCSLSRKDSQEVTISSSRALKESESWLLIAWSARACILKHKWVWSVSRDPFFSFDTRNHISRLCQWERAIFDPPQNRHPQPITNKFVTGDYVGDPYGCAKLGAYPSTGGFWAHGWNITKIIFIYAPFLRNSPTGQTRWQIFTHDGSNDAVSRKDVPFWRILHIAPHLGGQKTPKKNNFGAWIGDFKPNSQNRKTCILSKLLHRFQPNFAQW